jgi:hypothetical protein
VKRQSGENRRYRTATLPCGHDTGRGISGIRCQRVVSDQALAFLSNDMMTRRDGNARTGYLIKVSPWEVSTGQECRFGGLP